MLTQVYERRGCCLAALGRKGEARESFKAAVEAMAGAKVTEEKRAEVVRQLMEEEERVGEEGSCPVAVTSARDRIRVWSRHKQVLRLDTGLLAGCSSPASYLLIQDGIQRNEPSNLPSPLVFSVQ